MTARTELQRWIAKAQLAAIDGDSAAVEEALFRALRQNEQIQHDATALDRLVAKAAQPTEATERRVG